MAKENFKKPVMTIPPQREIDAFVEDAVQGNFAAVKKFVDQYPSAINHENAGDLQAEGRGFTALFRAAGMGHTEIVKFLLENGADINQQTVHGWTPLMTAAGSGHADVVDLLMENGADSGIKSDEGNTARDLARAYGAPETAAFLENWPEIKRQRQEARALAEDIADFSPALKKPLRALRPFGRKR